MLTLRDLLCGVVLPAVVSAVWFLVAWQPWRRAEPIERGHWGGPVAIGGGFAAAFLGLFGPRPFPPLESNDWLFYLVVPAVAWGVVDSLWRVPGWLRGGVGLILFAGAASLMLRPIIHHAWRPVQAGAWLAMLAIVGTAWWTALEALARRRPGPSLPLEMLIVAALAGLVLMLSESKVFGVLGGAVAATIAGGVGVAWFAPNLSLARGATLSFAILFCGLLLCGRFYASLAGMNAALLFAALPMAWVCELPALKARPAWQQGVVRTTLLLIPALIALGLAGVEFARAMSQTSGEYGY